MLRQIIEIDRNRCNGCGICANACHEGAIAITDGKASLIKEDYCDGMGGCLPECPQHAISFVTREAAEYDASQVKEHLRSLKNEQAEVQPGMMNWPCQIKLAPMSAPYYQNCDLLIAADCTAYAYAKIHEEYMKDRIVLIGCSKLDGVDYSEKLSSIFLFNSVRTITVLRMEVPCCGGLEYMVKTAVENCGKDIPMNVIMFSIGGEIL